MIRRYLFFIILSTTLFGGLAYAILPAFATNPSAPTVSPTNRRGVWVDESIIAWDYFGADSYELHYDLSGSAINVPATAGAGVPLSFAGTATANSYPKSPNVAGYDLWEIPSMSLPLVPDMLKGDYAIAAYAGGALVGTSRVQAQGVLDALYSFDGELGLTYNGATPSLALWAPTARSVTLHRYTNTLTTTVSIPHVMSLNPSTGVWSITGDSAWDKQYYQYEVEVFVPATGQLEHNFVTDPYSINLSLDSQRSQFLDIYNDPALKPIGWDSFTKPAYTAPEDMAIYEVHVRDFSIRDFTVLPAHQGKFVAFTYDGVQNPLSDGMSHLLNLQQAGLTHVHLLPAFDIASVVEDETKRTEPDFALLSTFPPDSDMQQTVISNTRALDGFNWGYDPYHYGVPEGSYATNPDDLSRVIEFRQMVQTLNENGLRVVMDVVYNHTSSYTQFDQSVLDKIVPNYYYRYNADGVQEFSSCCADTAVEYDMMEKLMVDTVLLWAKAYKVDSFRFDLMNLHTVDSMTVLADAVAELDPLTDGVDGAEIYIYGEGWDFGSATGKGLFHANQYNMAGTGIGTFNDKIRDATHGGFSTDSLQIRQQGFINGQSYDWNGHFYGERFQADLRYSMDRLRVGLAGSLQNYMFIDQGDTVQSGAGLNGTGYTTDPQETVNYISKHDNETLYDLNAFKLPAGTSMADRVRSQNMGLSIVSLSQGVPFFHLGSDMLRSKSLDRNTYDSGDWFNLVDFTYNDNNFAKGLPPAWDNQTRWPIMQPLLADPALVPAQADIVSNVVHLQEMLQIRQSSKLFRLESAADIQSRLHFYNTGSSQVDGLIVMSLSDAVGADLDPNYEYIVVLFNADKNSHSFTLGHLAGTGMSLHPVQLASADPLVQTATFNDGTGEFVVPARTTAVFVTNNAPTGTSNIGWVGDMFPLGGQSSGFEQGSDDTLTVYTQVYKAGVTGSNNGSNGGRIGCFLHWGQYGAAWTATPMVFNAGFGGSANNDEYSASIAIADLPVGTYGFTTYCTDDGYTRYWRSGGDGLLTVFAPEAATTDDVLVHLFEWQWTDVALECENWLAPMGYEAVQVSPPNEHLDPSLTPDFAWWARYQSVSYLLQSRSGTRAEFIDMVNRCHAVGVKVYVDAVINHMSAFATGTGSGGSSFSERNYPAVPYVTANFQTPDCGIGSFTDRTQVQTCDLLGLDDLDQANPDTRAKIVAYLNDLMGIGVDGIRIDAAKHIPAHQLSLVLSEVISSPVVYSEVIEAFGEPVQGFEYFNDGLVTEFDYSQELGIAFSGNGSCVGNLAGLAGFGASSSLMRSGSALVFVDNHDNQRGHGTANPCIVTHQDGAIYDLATVFMLGWPYGNTRVMSSYYFVDDTHGPPADGSGNTEDVYVGGVPVGCNGSDWVCEHRRTPIANMVGFRAHVHGQVVTDWWDNGNDHIAFGRGGRGFVVLNREASDSLISYQTSLPAGTYCNLFNGTLSVDGTSCTGDSVTVDGSGLFTETVTSLTAVILQSNLFTAPPAVEETLTASLNLSQTEATFDWQGHAPNCQWRMYESATPYWTVQEEDAPLVTMSAPTTQVVAPYGLLSRYYQLQAVNCNGRSTTDSTNTVGLFTFALQAGD